jgi:hypothetical protein
MEDPDKKWYFTASRTFTKGHEYGPYDTEGQAWADLELQRFDDSHCDPNSLFCYTGPYQKKP